MGLLRNGFSRTLILLTGGVAVAVAAATQSQTSAPSELVLRVTTRMLSVDVVVTDRDGHPITDLNKSDFTVLEDGKPQAIASFWVSNPTKNAPKPDLPPLLPPHVTSNRPDIIAASDHVGVLLLDGLNTPPQNQVYVKQQMLKFLAENFDPGRKLAIVALTDKLEVLQDFTSAPALLRAALERYRASSPALARNGGERDLSSTTPTAPAVSLPAQATGGPVNENADPTASATSGGSADTIQNDVAYMMRRFEKESENFSRDVRISTTLGALQEIARYLAGRHGRKSLLWFSTGFPVAVAGIDAEDMAVSRSYGEELRRTTNLLNDAHVAIYAIDASGLLVGKISDPANSGRDGAGRIALTMEANKNLAKDDFARIATENTLERAALDTGGRFFHSNDIAKAIAASLQDAGSYYLLGYYPTNKKWDGKFRSVRVKVDRPGLTVHSRQGYFALDMSPREADAHKDDFKAAVRANVLPATEVTFMSRALPPPHNGDLVVEFLVDSSTVSFQTTAFSEGNASPVARQSCSLNFEVQAFTPKGKLVKAAVQSADANLEPQTYERVRKQGIPMKVPVNLPPGHYLLHLGVRDNRTGLLGTSELAVDVGGN